ncbi:hypothetical protein T4E_1831 [Trichinella pseudospiralis]|uniref:Uncharacterized protein n=1 Tax=Trichinella pseudospiralis TaxID=6337 RepID=A0A0V0Y4Z3_TRIPS|nr:hypothetical protein T4E_1831 [Trichinella pseudospiralis]KRY88050.1 hypothetical protein T4D_14132 [Trichinella pseudospiralis]
MECAAAVVGRSAHLIEQQFPIEHVEGVDVRLASSFSFYIFSLEWLQAFAMLLQSGKKKDIHK